MGTAQKISADELEKWRVNHFSNAGKCTAGAKSAGEKAEITRKRRRLALEFGDEEAAAIFKPLIEIYEDIRDACEEASVMHKRVARLYESRLPAHRADLEN